MDDSMNLGKGMKHGPVNIAPDQSKSKPRLAVLSGEDSGPIAGSKKRITGSRNVYRSRTLRVICGKCEQFQPNRG